jgi:hypothetical protein
VSPINKGKAGEREFCDWLNREVVPYFLEIEPAKRNLDQTRDGGFDVLLGGKIAFEVKRCEKLDKKNWWLQIQNAVKDTDYIPVVAYRQNRKKWCFLMSAECLGLSTGFVEIDRDTFVMWLLKGGWVNG